MYCNPAHRQELSPLASPLGRTAHAYLDQSLAQRAESIEKHVGEDCLFIELEHTGIASDGSLLRVHARKRSLCMLGNPGLAVLSVARVVEREENPERSLDLAAKNDLFRGMSQRDQLTAKRPRKG